MENRCANTIEVEQTATTAINSANLLINSNINFIFVEGSTDVDYLSRFIDSSKTIVLPTGSKGNLKQVRKSKDLLSDDYICICDQDYEQRIENDNKWFYYDYANQEMMVLHGDDSWGPISDELSLDTKILLSIRDASLAKLRVVTAIRCYYQDNILPFAITEYLENDYVLCASETDDFNKCIYKKMLECGVCSGSIKAIKELSFSIEFNDLKNKTNGHDAMEIFFVSLLEYVKKIKYDGIVGSKKMIYTKKHFVPLLRKLYLLSDFKNSFMYKKIESVYKQTKYRFFV